ncbi:MAG TPA: SDR family oxidoreductase [Solirubrobacteraceae bacterium]|jgi:nucleoside-diphosphate-sugar epimerase|nr:SDR family oxidoreductase [Solirubrobacteraceae bacterium]
MRVVIAGGHGKIALRLARRLSARGDSVVGLIRNRDHAGDVAAAGAEPVVCDLEHAATPEVAAILTGASAAVFAAGAGSGSGPARKWSVDRDGAIKLLEAARAAGVPRYEIISSVGAEAPPPGDDDFSVYLRAKAEADAAVQASDREWTIVRPGRLTDAPGTGRVRVGLEPFRGEIPRDDVAALLEALLHDPPAERRILYVNAGEDTIAAALQALASAGGAVEAAG